MAAESWPSCPTTNSPNNSNINTTTANNHQTTTFLPPANTHPNAGRQFLPNPARHGPKRGSPRGGLETLSLHPRVLLLFAAAAAAAAPRRRSAPHLVAGRQAAHPAPESSAWQSRGAPSPPFCRPPLPYYYRLLFVYCSLQGLEDGVAVRPFQQLRLELCVRVWESGGRRRKVRSCLDDESEPRATREATRVCCPRREAREWMETGLGGVEDGHDSKLLMLTQIGVLGTSRSLVRVHFAYTAGATQNTSYM